MHAQVADFAANYVKAFNKFKQKDGLLFEILDRTQSNFVSETKTLFDLFVEINNGTDVVHEPEPAQTVPETVQAEVTPTKKPMSDTHKQTYSLGGGPDKKDSVVSSVVITFGHK